MAKAKNIVGNIYGKLTVESRADNKGRYAYWNCICSCGNKTVVRGEHLRRGETISCRTCGSGWHRKDMLGLKFGKLTVVGFAGLGNKGCYMWECLCSCGKTIITRGSNLRTGESLSCGCSRIISITKHGKTGTKVYNTWLARKRAELKLLLESHWEFEHEFRLREYITSCAICGATKNLCLDHLLPLSLGYGMSNDNVCVLCKSCNSKKSKTYITDLAPEIRRKLIDASCEIQDNWEKLYV